jgi:phage anti-repressor protein
MRKTIGQAAPFRKTGRYEARTDNAPSRNALHTLPQRVEDSRPASGMIVVNVERGTVGGVDCEVVDGRELQQKLGSRQDFWTWMNARNEQLNIVENQGFEVSHKSVENRSGGRPRKECILTLKAAKKIAMAEHTDAGDAVRDYFLDRERISYEAPRQDVSLLDDIDARIDAKMDRFMDRFMDRLPSMIQAIGSVQAAAAPVKIVAPAEVASVAPVAEQVAAPDIISPRKKRGHDEQNATAADAAAGWVCQHRRH